MRLSQLSRFAVLTLFVPILHLAARGTAEAAPTPRTLAQRSTYGGMCMSGMCEWVMTVRSDGRVTMTGMGKTRRFTISSKRAAHVAALVASTDIDPATLARSTDCPPTYDGNATKYVLHRRNGTRTYDQCKVTLPTGGVFSELDRLWLEAVPLLSR